MAIVDQKWSALPVPHAMEFADRVPKERYFDPDFFQLEAELALAARSGRWPAGSRRSPKPTTSSSTRSSTSRSSCCARMTGRCAPSRTPADTAGCGSSRAGERARAGSPAPSTDGATARTARTPSSPRRGRSPSTTCSRTTSTSRPCAARCGAAAPWINLDDDAPPLRQCIEPFATTFDAWKLESMRDRVVVRLPPPGQLEAGRRGVPGAVPRDRDPSPAASSPAVPAPRPAGVRPPGVRRRRAPVPAHDERGHGRHGPRQRRARRRGPRATSSCPPTPSWPCPPGTAPSTTPSCAGTATAGCGHPRPQRARRRRGSTSPWATASPTTSCCPCTAAPPPTGSDPSARRRR